MTVLVSQRIFCEASPAPGFAADLPSSSMDAVSALQPRFTGIAEKGRVLGRDKWQLGATAPASPAPRGQE